MKKSLHIAAILLIAIVAVPAFAAPAILQTGTSELGVAGFIEFSDEVDLSLTYGYFVTDAIEIKGIVAGSWIDQGDLGDASEFGIGGGVDYHIFQMATDVLVPYVTGAAGYYRNDVDPGISALDTGATDGFSIDAGVGVKYFMASNVALNVALKWQWNSEDVYLDKDDPKDNRVVLPIGLNFYF